MITITSAIPKPLLPVGEKPIIVYIIEHMKNHGIEHIFISVNYKKELIKNYLRDGSRYGVKIEYIEEDDPTRTAGSLSLLPDSFLDDILVSNGDLIADVDYKKLYSLLDDYDMVIVAVEKELKLDFGILDVGKNMELLSWRKKQVLR